MMTMRKVAARDSGGGMTLQTVTGMTPLTVMSASESNDTEPDEEEVDQCPAVTRKRERDEEEENESERCAKKIQKIIPQTLSSL